MFLSNIPTQGRQAKLVILPTCKSKEYLRSNINAKLALPILRLFLRKTAHRKDSNQMQFGTRIRSSGKCPKAQIFTTNSFTAKTIIQGSIAESSNRLVTHTMESNRLYPKKNPSLLKFQSNLSTLRTKEMSF